MSVPSAQRSGSPPDGLSDRSGGRPAPKASTTERRGEASVRPPIGEICPYLVAASGGWRSAAPHRDHRCGAVEPPAPLSSDKQRRLCLAADHVTCQTYQAARTSRASMLAPGLDPAVVAAADASRRPIARSTAVVLEQPRLGAALARWPLERTPTQIVLVALMALAFVALVVARLSAGDASSLPSPDPPLAASPSAVGTPSPRPSPSSPPSASPSASTSAGASAGPSAGSPSPSPSLRTYRVQQGDTLIGIASEFGTTVAALRELNGIEGSALRVGQILTIPPPASP